MTSCGDQPESIAIETTRLGSRPSRQVVAGTSLAERMGMRSRPTQDGSSERGAPAPGLLYDLPEGWIAKAPTQFRKINLQYEADPRAELTLTFLQSDGGGVLANVNRWRSQVKLEPLTAAEIDALPTRDVFRQPATLVEMFGPYQGMSGPEIEDGGMLGAIFSRQGGTLFVKLVGPREIVEAERANFEAFLDSLDVAEPTGGGGGATSMAGAGQPSPLAWEPLAGWTEEPGNGFREVTFRKGDVQMYVSLATGGALPNINRWATQLGMPLLSDERLAALPRVPMLGENGYVFEGVGALQGMGASAPTPGQRMLAALVEKGGQIVTVKTTGPDADVDAARSEFFALVASLRRSN